mmetsp:Transcript_68630/g.178768  ORF Transcript_68630/g.178768 Transcript_68630/m.178768 type:complete len:210 (+) Transcript_68630:474-1103(+)
MLHLGPPEPVAPTDFSWMSYPPGAGAILFFTGSITLRAAVPSLQRGVACPGFAMRGLSCPKSVTVSYEPGPGISLRRALDGTAGALRRGEPMEKVACACSVRLRLGSTWPGPGTVSALGLPAVGIFRTRRSLPKPKEGALPKLRLSPCSSCGPGPVCFAPFASCFEKPQLGSRFCTAAAFGSYSGPPRVREMATSSCQFVRDLLSVMRW